MNAEYVNPRRRYRLGQEGGGIPPPKTGIDPPGRAGRPGLIDEHFQDTKMQHFVPVRETKYKRSGHMRFGSNSVEMGVDAACGRRV